MMLGALNSQAQTSTCPANIDFSTGTWDHWEGRSGTVHGALGDNFINWLSTGIDYSRVRMVAPNNPILDWYGGFPQDCPYTNTYTVVLGNTIGFHEADGLSYTFTIPTGSTNFSLTYYYAVVLQNPGHSDFEQPRFRAKVIDVAANKELECVSFDYAANSSLPGFEIGKEGVIYKPWTAVSVDLGAYAGKTMRLEFITSDCIFEQHFGYAYISLAPTCNGNISGTYICEGDDYTTFSAPGGFSSYEWYADASFNQVISTSTTVKVTLDNYQIGDMVPLVVTPHTGFGCRDTFYAIIKGGTKPPAFAGTDNVICSNAPLQIGTSPHQDYGYVWSPSYYLNDSLRADPTIVRELDGIKNFVVKTIDLLNGCINYDTVTITPKLIDTSVTVNGQLIYCPGETLQTSFTVNNTAAEWEWYRGNQPVSLSNPFQPASPGIYWARMKQFGCIDSTSTYSLQIAPTPSPSFTTNKVLQCINNSVQFINTTPAGPLATYEWIFSDGYTSDDKDMHRQFAAAGQYTAKLIVTTGNKCRDSVEKVIPVVEFCYPVMPDAFTPNNDGLNDKIRPFLPGAKMKRFTVYNRWGQIVFTTTKEMEGWDGTYKGGLQPAGVYVWLLEYEDGKKKTATEKGSFVLIR